jgi:hypothetical protein
MPMTAVKFSVNQLILDCADLAIRLDAMRDEGPAAVPAAIESACVEYQRLLLRRNALPAAATDVGLVQFMLDSLRVRLSSLERRN